MNMVIIFNHGYIPPAEYRTTERCTAYVDAFVGAGYIVFKSAVDPMHPDPSAIRKAV